MVSEVSFRRFWGVLCIAMCFRFFVSVIGSAVAEISHFARFYVKKVKSILNINIKKVKQIRKIQIYNILE